MVNFSERVENSVGKKEKLLLTSFQVLYCRHVETRAHWERLSPFSTVFQLYCSGQCTYLFFPGVLLTTSPHDILSKPLSHITIVETMDDGESGMNPVVMTIINPRKYYWPSLGSDLQPPVLKSYALPTEPWDSTTQLLIG